MKNFILLITLFSLCACSLQKSPTKILRMNLGTEPPTLDWNLAKDSTSFDIISNIMVGLTRFSLDANNNITVTEGVADSWQISADNKKYLFHLNPKAQWTDGRQVIAQDFIDSFERLLDPQTAAPYADLLSIIDLKHSKAIDNENLEIVLKRPAAYFIYLTAYGLTLPIRKDLIQKHGRNWTESENLVSNGPFTLSSWHHEYKITLKRNPNFHLQINTQDPRYKNLAQEIRFFMVPEQASAFNLFANDSLDFIDNRSIPLSVMKQIANEAQKIAILRNTYIGLNHEKKPFDDINMRKAFSYAIDREALVNIIGKGDQANNTWIPPSLKNFFNTELLVQNFNKEFALTASEKDYQRGYFPKLAKEFFAKSKYKKEDLEKIVFLIPNRETSKILAESLQAMWQQVLGITVEIQSLEWKVFLAKLKNDTPELFRLNWGADYPDPDTFISLFSSNNQINYGHFKNSQYDKLSQEAASILDLNTRKKLYSELETILSQQEQAIIPLFIDTQNILTKTNIKGLEVNSMDISFLDKVEILEK